MEKYRDKLMVLAEEAEEKISSNFSTIRSHHLIMSTIRNPLALNECS